MVDSHTGGEPTRVVVAGGPELGGGTVGERLERFRERYDHVRRAVVNEPRGSDVIVGALLCEPLDADASAGVIFFNNVGYLGMCGHGTIGLIATLAHLRRIRPGAHRLETPVGGVDALLHEDGRVTVRNVPAFVHRRGVSVDVGGRTLTGDVAWGGNWFFLTDDHGEEVSGSNLERLTAHAWAIRESLREAGVTGEGGAEIDHIELFGPSEAADSRNFVLCPGKAYDRSPCGTGTSAKLALLAADGELAPGEVWRQESVIGSSFEASYEPLGDGSVLPSITGRAYVTAEATLILAKDDPFRWGIGGPP